MLLSSFVVSLLLLLLIRMWQMRTFLSLFTHSLTQSYVHFYFYLESYCVGWYIWNDCKREKPFMSFIKMWMTFYTEAKKKNPPITKNKNKIKLVTVHLIRFNHYSFLFYLPNKLCFYYFYVNCFQR